MNIHSYSLFFFNNKQEEMQWGTAINHHHQQKKITSKSLLENERTVKYVTLICMKFKYFPQYLQEGIFSAFLSLF